MKQWGLNLNFKIIC